ncbi:MAG: PAS domain-containing sensor histidine kinase [Chloroflexi bacterium]|nr:PAS domain-containing sensor histidine kinase [Chloroflexota bacterium]
MSKVRLDVSEVPYLPVFPFLRGRFTRLKHHLGGYRAMLRQGRFWVIVIMMLFISAAHTILETAVHLPAFGILYFVPSAFFLVPVVFAALTFGLRGALITSLTATVITIPNWFLFHESWETLGCISQLFVVNIAAYFVGQQVNRVRSAQQHAEATRALLRASETKYRGLFESSPIAILVLDGNGTILDANPTAGILFNRIPATLKSMAVADLIGTADAQKLLDSSRNSRQPDSLILKPKDGPELYIEPTLTEADGGQGNFVIQVVFRDVTEERYQQAGLRAYAAHVLRVQEQERQRIARELHDGTVQQLVLLYRQLGNLENSSDSLPSAFVDLLRDARGISEEVIKELRDFTGTLRPPVLEDLGLVTAVRRLLSDLIQRAGLKGQMKVIGNRRQLPSDTELGMFRIAQEALRNVERHAKATHIELAMAFTEHEVSLDLHDNGMGFVVPPFPGDFTASGHLGLISMQERAKLLNGKLEIRSSPGNGTRVIVSVPI